MHPRLCTDSETFFRLKERWTLQLQRSDFRDNLDLGMYPILTKLNELPGLTTVFCCASHPDKAEEERKFYIMFAVLPEGLEYLEGIFSDLFTELRQKDGFPAVGVFSHLSLSAGWHIDVTRFPPGRRISVDAEEFYRTMVLETYVATEKAKEILLQRLDEVVMKYWLAYSLAKESADG